MIKTLNIIEISEHVLNASRRFLNMPKINVEFMYVKRKGYMYIYIFFSALHNVIEKKVKTDYFSTKIRISEQHLYADFILLNETIQMNLELGDPTSFGRVYRACYGAQVHTIGLWTTFM